MTATSNASSSTPDNSAGPSTTAPVLSRTTTSSGDDGGVTPLQLGFAAIILGASAGLTLYTKKTSHMLQQFERASKNKTQREGPPNFGPKTRAEWERLRNRWEKDDL